MANTIYSVVREFTVFVDGLGFKVKARIIKVVEKKTDTPYSWEISHYYKPSIKSGSVYIPSGKSAENLQKAEELLMAYLKPFTNFCVEENPFY